MSIPRDAQIERIVSSVESEQGITKKELLGYLLRRRQKITKVPISIFSSPLSPLQALVVFLADHGYRFSEIAIILDRDQRSIGNTHRAAKKKFSGELPKKKGLQISLALFANRRRSLLEHICSYLHDMKKMSFCSIATMINRDERTIWTAWRRAMDK